MSTSVKIEDISIMQNTSIENLPNELWKPIMGFEENYEISNYSRVKRIKVVFIQKSKSGKLHRNLRPPSILKQHISKRGYYTLTLQNKPIKKRAKIHRLVAIHFIPKVKGKDHVNHINGIKTDNRVENLEWCTNQENTQHSYDFLNRKTTKGVLNKGSSKKVFKFNLKGVLLKEYPSCAEAARELNGTTSNIAKCARGGIKNAYGYVWKYLN